MKDNRLNKAYILEYSLKFSYSFNCDKCKNENVYEQTISRKKEEIVIGNSEEELILSDCRKEEIFSTLKQQVDEEFNRIKNLAHINNYSCLKYVECSKCHEIAQFNIKNHVISKIILQAIIYMFCIFIAFLLNIFLHDLMLSYFERKEFFFTSIFFFPTVVFAICLIFFIIDIVKINNKYKIDDKNIQYPKIDFDNIVIEKNIFDSVNSR